MDLIAGVFGLFQFACDDRSAARSVYFLRVVQRLIVRQNEDLAQHLDNVVVGMVVVIQQHHTVEGAFPIFSGTAGRGLRCRHARARLRLGDCHPDISLKPGVKRSGVERRNA